MVLYIGLHRNANHNSTEKTSKTYVFFVKINAILIFSSFQES
uniref:Uncharacterized protein n=1 Tax=Anguilla anguilla TaxID=7936 RepID=A0A0E9RYV1_ANGAN